MVIMAQKQTDAFVTFTNVLKKKSYMCISPKSCHLSDLDTSFGRNITFVWHNAAL